MPHFSFLFKTSAALGDKMAFHNFIYSFSRPAKFAMSFFTPEVSKAISSSMSLPMGMHFCTVPLPKVR